MTATTNRRRTPRFPVLGTLALTIAFVGPTGMHRVTLAQSGDPAPPQETAGLEPPGSNAGAAEQTAVTPPSTAPAAPATPAASSEAELDAALDAGAKGSAGGADSAQTKDAQAIAKALEVSVVRRSSSSKTYLFKLESGEAPTAGRIVLVREGQRPVMAFRVLKIYPESGEFAAKRVRRYRGYRILDPGRTFLALEKIGETNPLSLEDSADLKDLEGLRNESGKAGGGGARPPTAPVGTGAVNDPLSDPSLERYRLKKKTGEADKGDFTPGEGSGVLEFDPELDASSTPPPAADATNDKSDHMKDDVKPLFEDNVEDGAAAITVEEVTPFDLYRHGLSFVLGLQRNLRYPTGSNYFTSGAVRYGFTAFRNLILYSPSLQDSLTFEGGFGFYKLVNFVVSRDAYSLLPLMGTLRYNVHFSENLAGFVYGGVSKGLVISASLGTVDGAAALSGILPAFGGGLILRVGPSWDVRADLGIDMIAAGMMIRF